jgi:hypothetical protein
VAFGEAYGRQQPHASIEAKQAYVKHQVEQRLLVRRAHGPPVPSLAISALAECVMDGGITDLEPESSVRGVPEFCTNVTKHFITVIPPEIITIE